MKKILIEGFKLNDDVLITSYDPPLKARVLDMYELDNNLVPDFNLNRMYPHGVPVFEVVLEDTGKVQTFVKNVVKKA